MTAVLYIVDSAGQCSIWGRVGGNSMGRLTFSVFLIWMPTMTNARQKNLVFQYFDCMNYSQNHEQKACKIIREGAKYK